MTPAPSGSSALPLVRVRLAVALIAAVVVALELSLMRGLALRFSSHFAGIVISLGLLGFGAAGSVLTLFRSSLMRYQRSALVVLGLALAASIPLIWWMSQGVPLNVNYLAWSLQEAPHVLQLELLMLVPFALAGAFIGVVLMDLPRRINGHYAADLLGSGSGGMAAVAAMNYFSPAQLLAAQSIAALAAALLLLRWRSAAQWAALAVFSAATLLLLAQMPRESTPNPYKPLTLSRQFAGTETIYHAEGPLGRIDVIAGPNLHAAPQLSLQYFDELPPHMELYVDGDGPALIYDCGKTEDWVFADYRTAASPYFIRGQEAAPAVCVIGAGGGVEIGTALLHRAPSIVALESNPQVIAAMEGPLASRGGAVYRAAGVEIVNQEARGFFAANDRVFDIIQFPPMGGFGAAGSDATHESYAYTIESVRAMLRHLTPGGVLAITRGVGTPPREELRAFDLAAEALRAEGADPVRHLAMIRGAFSCTILAWKKPMEEAQLVRLRAFCKKMGFDPCYFPGITEREANPKLDPAARARRYGIYNIVDHPYYYSGPQALAGSTAEREAFIAGYPFNIAAPRDNQPYFFHTFQWSRYGGLRDQYGMGSRAFLEVSYVMLVVALSQAVLLALILILLPMTPGINALRHAAHKVPSLAYFLLIGLGFMLLEMAFVQKLVLYLAHPLYAAAVVIASFLVFAGMGSQMSRWWRSAGASAGQNRIVSAAAIVICLLGGGFLAGLDPWLGLSVSWGIGARCAVAAFTIAPLAFAMGHLFPMGLLRTSENQPALVPWGWAINGFASVLAAAGAPLLSMQFGFAWLVIIAISCYIIASVAFRRMTSYKVNASTEFPISSR
jgi:hypothetical protein